VDFKFVDEFVYELGREEPDHWARAKIDALKLTEDVVEAIEFLKALYVRDLIFREPEPTSILEEELEVFENDNDPDWVDEEEPKPWDTFVIDICR
jgi:hypothetical protein